MLDHPVVDKDTQLLEFSYGPVGASGMQGWRPEMEDSHIACTMPSLPNHLFLAVFDGHGGARAAIYAGDHLVSVIENTEKWKRYVNSSEKDPELLAAALQDSFIEIDVQLRVHQANYVPTSDSRAELTDTSGCTATTCMVTPDYFVCANAGDSRTVLGTNGTTVPLSEDHKPSDPIEEQRIVDAGGVVQWKRVDGNLAVSRGLGDFEYKNRDDLGVHEQKVTCIPDIKILSRTPQDEVLVLACDGLWDVFSSEDAIAAIREIFASGESDIALTTEEMLDLSLNVGSKDNISAVLLRLPGATIGDPSGGGVMARRRIRDKEAEEAEKADEEAERRRMQMVMEDED